MTFASEGWVTRVAVITNSVRVTCVAVINNSAWVTCTALKTAYSLVEFILAHRSRQNRWPSLGVGLKPNASNEFKRGGFLEVQPEQSHCRVGLNRRRRIFSNPQLKAGFGARPTFAYLQLPRKSLLGFRPNRQRCFDRFAFKKTCPCVPSRAGVAQHGRQRTSPTRFLEGRSQASQGSAWEIQVFWRRVGIRADRAVNSVR